MESRGEVEGARGAGGFNLDLPNYGLTTEQTIELQQALARVGCEVGSRDGVMGQRTLRGLQCFRAQQPLSVDEVESMLRTLGVSFAKPVVAEQPAPAKRDAPPPLPPVIRPDTTYRPDVRARRDSVFRRDSTVFRDPVTGDTMTRRDSTARRDTSVRRPPPR